MDPQLEEGHTMDRLGAKAVRLWLAGAVLAAHGVGAWPFKRDRKDERGRALPMATESALPRYGDGPELEQLEVARRHVLALGERLEAVRQDLLGFGSLSGAREHGQFTSADTDRIETTLYRFLAAREALWESMVYHGRGAEHFHGAEAQTKSFVVSWHAATLVAASTAEFVDTYVDQRLLVRKLDEEYHRSGIPAGTFQALLIAVTRPDSIRALRDSRERVRTEAATAGSCLAGILASDRNWRELHARSDRLCGQAERHTDSVLRKTSLVLPEVTNVVRSSLLAEQARRAGREISQNLYEAQGVLFTQVGDVKQPASPPADFNPDQVAEIKSLLSPGDLLLTFSAGYMSNVFLPGRFKHGILYIGRPAERAAAGLTAAGVTDLPTARRATLAEDLARAKLPNGYDADVIEAVSEGVIFNSIDRLLKFHINRMVALRPRVTPQERATALLQAFMLTGSRYDFKFDFADVSEQCCTEVLYRAYNTRGGLEFKLVPRMGVLTFSADDLVGYALAPENRQRFDILLLAEEDAGFSDHRGRVLTGDAAAERLREIMEDRRFDLPEFRPSLPDLLPPSWRPANGG